MVGKACRRNPFAEQISQYKKNGLLAVESGIYKHERNNARNNNEVSDCNWSNQYEVLIYIYMHISVHNTAYKYYYMYS